MADARAAGAGQRYLIQHSAGSGKSFTIAWLAHQFATLHDASDRRVFYSIVVITDRRDLDNQLFGAFQRSQLLPEEPVKVTSRAELRDELANRTFRSLIGLNLIPYRDCHRQPRLAQYLEDRFRELPGSYRELQAEIRSRLKVRTVVVTEYPADLFDSAAGCGSLELVTIEEAQWLASHGRRLNEIIRDSWGPAVTEIAPAFAGHGYCATPTFYGHLSQSLDRQLDYLGVLHPNADGHRVYRDAILRALQAPGGDRK